MIREGRTADWPCLKARFYDEFGQHSLAARGVPRQILMGKLLVLLESKAWRLITAVPEWDADEILGLLLYKPGANAAAWLTVKEVYRGRGVGRALVDQAGIKPGNVDCAFIDPMAAKRAERHGYKLRYRPYLPDVAQWDTLRDEVERDAART